MQPLFHFWNAPESLGPGYFFFNFLIWLSNVLSFCFKICYGFFSCSVIKRSNEPPGLFINTRQQKLPQTRSSTFSLGWIKRKISEELQVFDSLAADFDCFFNCRYMKGRLTYDQINAVVQDLNKAVVGKYKILHQPLKSMNASVRNLYHRFLGEETKDTKGKSALVYSQNRKNKKEKEQKLPMEAPTTPCHGISGPPLT